MKGCKGLRTRWKGKIAWEIARGDPISAIYETMKEWGALSGLFVNSAILLQVDRQQAQILSRGGFGRSYPLPVQHSSSASTSGSEERVQLLQLGLEESFFLNYEVKCIEVYRHTFEGRIVLNHKDLWTLMERSKAQFLQYYGAYSYMRCKRWVVLSGIQYGADFVAYRHHPALVHSDYAVLIMVGEGKQDRLSTWTDLQSMQRLCGSVAKTLLLLNVSWEDAQSGSEFPHCLHHCNVEAVEVGRWIPETHRAHIGIVENMS